LKYSSLEIRNASEKIRRTMMEVRPALALSEGFHLVGLEKQDDVLTVTLVSCGGYLASLY
jgi:hypothetical protein